MAKRVIEITPAKLYPILLALSPTKGVTVIDANQIGDTIYANVSFRDPSYLWNCGLAVMKASLEGSIQMTKLGIELGPEKPQSNTGKVVAKIKK